VIKQTLQEWLDEGKQRFGDDFTNWRFKCPACGHVASGQDFKDLGANPNDMYQVCIGRVNGKGTDGTEGKDEGNGCNWAAYGLFGTLGKGRIVINEDKEVQVFDFA
jgi:hypothetical protein